MRRQAKTIADPPPIRGWVLYDQACPFCRWWLGVLKNILLRRGFLPTPLQEPWVARRLEMDPHELLYDLRLLTKRGELICGAEVYLFLARRIWWAWPFYALFRLPGFNRLLHAGYRWFASNRYCVSGHCHVFLNRAGRRPGEPKV